MNSFLNKLLLIFIVLPVCLIADDRVSSFQFLKTIYSPRLAALGGAYGSLGGDIYSMYINPAGLAWVRRGEISFNYGDYLLDLKGGWLGFSYPLNNKINLGSGIIYFDYGSFVEADRFGDMTGNTFNARDVALSASVAGNIKQSFSWGFTLKYAYSKIDRYSAGAAVVDMGILYRAKFLDNLIAGLAVRNLGKSLDAYYQCKESLPTTVNFALTKWITPYPINVHAGWNNVLTGYRGAKNALSNFSLGFEIGALEELTLRLGYNNQRKNDLNGSIFNGISAGLGLKLGMHQFDYGYSNYGDMGAIHHFGLTFRFGDNKGRFAKKEDQVTRQPDILLPPQDIRFAMEADTLTIYWEPVRGASYNLYVRLEDNEDWLLINKAPQEQHYLKLKAPRAKGNYIFRVALVVRGKERYFSKEFRLQIKNESLY